MELGGGLVEVGGVLGAEDGDGDGVFEDVGRGIVDLVGRSAQGYAEGGSGWEGFLHPGFSDPGYRIVQRGGRIGMLLADRPFAAG